MTFGQVLCSRPLRAPLSGSHKFDGGGDVVVWMTTRTRKSRVLAVELNHQRVNQTISGGQRGLGHQGTSAGRRSLRKCTFSACTTQVQAIWLEAFHRVNMPWLWHLGWTSDREQDVMEGLLGVPVDFVSDGGVGLHRTPRVGSKFDRAIDPLITTRGARVETVNISKTTSIHLFSKQYVVRNTTAVRPEMVSGEDFV